MGISTSSKLTILPGLDQSITTAADVAIDQNDKVLDILLNSASTSGTQTAIDSAEEVAASIAEGKLTNNPLPTYGFFTNGNSSYNGWAQFDSYHQAMHSGPLNNSTEIMSRRSESLWYVQGNPSTSTLGSTYSVMGTSFQGADGHAFIGISGTDNFGPNYGWAKDPYSIAGTFRDCGVIIGKPGIRQETSIRQSSQTIQLAVRGSSPYIETLNIASSTYSTWASRTGYGSIGYNDRSKTLVILESDASNNIRMHVWKNNNPGNELNLLSTPTGALHRFMSEAKAAGTPTSEEDPIGYFYNDFTWNDGGSSSYEESRYRFRVVPGDNGLVGLSRMVPSNATQYTYVTPDYSATSITNPTTLMSQGLTTSYGMDQGTYYGMRHQIAWDNDWVVSYNVYYYYMAGMVANFCSSKDPSKYYRGNYNTTNYGSQIVPLNKSKFLFNYSGNNGDGQGSYGWVVDPSGTLANDGYTGINAGNISNGGSLPMTSKSVYGNHDSYYWSTMYPVLYSPDYWTHG